MSTTTHFPAAELARLCALKGVRHAVLSPGSRSAPLVIAFHRQPEIGCLTVIDERSAGFFALGIALATGDPVVLICTSGSAVLNYGPAIAEAFYQRVPLLMITADRPEEWVDQGEGQAIRQQGVLALHLRRSIQLPRSPSDDLARWHCGRMINEAIDATRWPVRGPVHVNMPVEEPLYAIAAEQPASSRTIQPMAVEATVNAEHLQALADDLMRGTKVLILAGQGSWIERGIDQLVRIAGMPQVALLTEATSGLEHPAFISCIDRTIAGMSTEELGSLRPELLITFGGGVVSKRIKSLLRRWRPEQHWNIDAGQRHYDTYQCLTHDIPVTFGSFIAQLSQLLPPRSPNPSDYAAQWRSLADRTRKIHGASLKAAPFCDLKAFDLILNTIPQGSDVHLANSTPVRYAQLFDRQRGHHFFSNRGTSGIDGCVSTAVGAAFATGKPTTVIVGDIAFCYDSNAFWNAHVPANLRVIVIDNGGGNIFRFIEGPDSDPELLRYFETPHGRDPMTLARSYGLISFEAFDGTSLKHGLEQLYQDHGSAAVLVVRTDAQLSPQVLRDYFRSLAEQAGASA